MKKILLTIIFLGTVSFTQSQNLLTLENEIRKSSPGENVLTNVSPAESVKKSTGLAIIYSLLLPGMGELYAGSYSSGKYFTIAEGALWGIFIGMNSYANWQKDRYKSFAASEGEVNLAGKDADYFSTISQYINIEEYNNAKALERNFDEMYNPSTYYWKWESIEERRAYRSMWLSSEQTFNDVRFVVGALIVNRIISAINAVRLVSAYNKRASEEMGWNISVGLSNNPDLSKSVTVNLHTYF
jgi:hypothetical protein